MWRTWNKSIISSARECHESLETDVTRWEAQSYYCGFTKGTVALSENSAQYIHGGFDRNGSLQGNDRTWRALYKETPEKEGRNLAPVNKFHRGLSATKWDLLGWQQQMSGLDSQSEKARGILGYVDWQSICMQPLRLITCVNLFSGGETVYSRALHLQILRSVWHFVLVYLQIPWSH